jgi:hypothetical protein
MLVRRYLKRCYLKGDRDGREEAKEGEDLDSEESGGQELILDIDATDVDATIIEADKGDGRVA